MKNIVFDIQRFAKDASDGNSSDGTINYDETSFGYLTLFANVIETLGLKKAAVYLKENDPFTKLSSISPIYKFVGVLFKRVGSKKLAAFADIIANGIEVIDSTVEIITGIKKSKTITADIAQKIGNVVSKIDTIETAILNLTDEKSSWFNAIVAAAIGFVANVIGSIDGPGIDIKESKELAKSDIKVLSSLATSFVKNVVEDENKRNNLTDPFGPIAQVTSLVTGIVSGFLEFKDTIDTYTADGIPKEIAIRDAVIVLISNAVHDTVSSLSKGIDDFAFELVKLAVAKIANVEVSDIDAEDKNYVEWIVEGLKTFNVKNSGNDEDNNLISDVNDAKIYAKAGNDYIRNFASNVTIWAGADNDTVFSHDDWNDIQFQSNSILAGPGDDIIISEAINETIYGGKGKDRLAVYGNNTKAYGEEDNDVIMLSGTSGNLINGGLGNDIIILEDAKNTIIEYSNGDGKDVICGYDESARINITGDYVTSASGQDITINVGNGAIIISDVSSKTININGKKFSTNKKDVSNGKVVIVPSIWSDDIKTIRGTSGKDNINNTTSNVIIRALKENDTVFSSANNVSIYGDDGDDLVRNEFGRYVIINGGNGNDILVTDESESAISSGGDHATINGDAGNDTIMAWADYAVVDGGTGDDYISVAKDSTITGGSGSDTIYCIDQSGSKMIITDFDETKDVLEIHSEISANMRNDSSAVFTLTAYNDDVILKNKYNEITFKGQTVEKISKANVTFPYSKYIFKLNKFLYNTVNSNDSIIYGTNDDDVLKGIVGTDVSIYGYAGNDNISCSAKNVLLYSDSGNDYIAFESDIGKSTIHCGTGNDTIVNPYATDDGKDDGSRFSDFSTFYGEDDNDTFLLGHLKNVNINGGSGDDDIRLFYSNNVLLEGENGDNTIHIYNSKDVTIKGGNDTDNISVLDKSSDVTISSGKGNDNVYLNASNIVIQYQSGDGDDNIKYFGEKDTLQIAGSSYSTAIDDRDIVVKVGSGSIRLLDAADTKLNIVTIKGGNSTPTIPPDTPSATNDTITNSTGGIRVNGTSGADKIFNNENGSNVTINAGSGNDTIENNGDRASISGGAGNDSIVNNNSEYVTINGGKGNDTLIGNGYDADVFLFAKGDGSDVITNYGSNDTIKITGGTYTKTTVSNDVIVSVENNGQIALKGAKGKTINIEGTLAGDKSNKVSIPSDAVTYNGHSYKLYTIGKVWNEAQSYCENLGGHLVAVNSSKEQTFIEKMIKNGTKNSYWLGGFKDSNNEWKWVTNETFSYTNWAYDEPNDAYGEEDKIMIFKAPDPKNSNANFGEWNDVAADCGEGEYPSSIYGQSAFGFICEWDTVIGSTSTTKSTTLTVTNSAKSPVTSVSTIKTIDATQRTKAIKIIANALANTIKGGSGVDSIYGGAGNDSINGNNGNDKLFGETGNDKLLGGNGADILNGGKGNDTLTGNAGNDVFVYANGDGNDVITDYKAGQDKIKITGKKITGTSVSGSDVILKVGTGSIKIKNGKGKTLSIYNNANSVTDTIIPSDGGSTTTSGKGKYIDNSDDRKVLTGGSGNDTIDNVADYVTINSGAGNDSIVSWGDNIKVNTGAGNDKVYAVGEKISISGGAGNDSLNCAYGHYATINGGKGNDTLRGSYEADVFQYADGDGNDVIFNYDKSDKISLSSSNSYSTMTSGQDIVVKVGSGKMTLKYAKGTKLNIVGGKKDSGSSTSTTKIPSGYTTVNVTSDVWYNNQKSKVVVNGISGDDWIDNYASNVIVNGNAGKDYITSWDKNYNTNSSATLKNITLNGGADNDTIYSFTDNSLVTGGDGNDSIFGSENKVTINAGKGNDTISTFTDNVILYANGDGNDVITQIWDDTKIKITSGSYSTLTSGDDFIIKVGSGKMTIKDSAYLADSINIIGTKNYEERWFLEGDDNFTTTDVSSILKNDNSIQNDYKLESELQLYQDNEMTSLAYTQTKPDKA